MKPLAFALGVVLASTTVSVRADDTESAVYARVIVDRAAVRSGPGATFRRVYAAKRDEVFPLRGRDSRGYWFRIQLENGTQGFIQGAAVHTLEVSDEAAGNARFLPGLFAPPVLPNAHGEVALSGGALGSGGIFTLRPSWLLAPSFGLELTGAVAVARGGRLLLGTLGPIVNFFPRSPIVPFATLAAGFVTSSPSSDTFLLEAGSVSALVAGAGLRITFRYRLTLRLDARSYVMFDADRTRRQEEFSAGLTVFF
jgi:hypothetical protein